MQNDDFLLFTGGWDVDQELDLPPEVAGAVGAGAADEKASSLSAFVEPTPGRSAASYWADNSPLAADLILAGEFILNHSVGWVKVILIMTH